jgi:hypothetical protein
LSYRLLLDENAMHRDWRRPLVPLFDAVETMQSLGRNGFGDEEHLEFAASEGWTMFTFDTATSPASTGSGSQRGRSHAGIIVDPNSLLPVGEMLRRMTRLLADFEERSLAGKLVYLSDCR